MAVVVVLHEVALAGLESVDIDIWEYGTRETHECYSRGAICDEPGYYYNWLACECFAQYHCEKACEEGMSVDWYSTCGQCIQDDKQRGLYPEWATDAEISSAVTEGIEAAQGRPEDWRICPRES